MRQHRANLALRLVLVPAVAALTVAPAACGRHGLGGSVTVLAPWVDSGPGSERDIFEHQVLRKFTEKTGIRVNYQATRALDAALQEDIEKGIQPDVALLPSLGSVTSYAAQGELEPLDKLLGGQQGRFGEQWLGLERAAGPADAQGKVYAAVFKVSFKSIVWYNPAALRNLLGPGWKPPNNTLDWKHLVGLTKRITELGRTPPWCMGMENTPNSGWPGTDWLEDILLHQSGVQAYQQWVNGRLSWPNSSEIQRAFTTWATVVAHPNNIEGGPQQALLKKFSDAGKPLFNHPPGCYLLHTAFIDNSKNALRPGIDYDFLTFPTFGGASGDAGNVYEVAADFAVMFQRTAQAEELIRFLDSDEGQGIWPRIKGSAAFSADQNIRPEDYPDDVTKRVAQLLLSRSATLCFDASDSMPAAMRNAFNHAVLAYLSNLAKYQNTDNLTALLEGLGKVANQVYSSGQWAFRCGHAQ